MENQWSNKAKSLNSSKSILKSTGLIGGSQVISIIFSIIRAKFIAILLGPAGTGLIGAFQSATSLVETTAALGVGNSAVREIAQANANGEKKEIAKTVKTQRRLVLLTGLLGLGLTMALAEPLSRFTFDSTEYIWEIRLLSISVFFSIIKGGQSALIQGMRRIKYLALLSIAGAILSTIISIPVILIMGMKGIAVFLVILAASQFLVSWYYARKIRVEKIPLSWKETWKRGKGMITLGLAFMGGAVASIAATYLIRVFIIRDFNLAAAGIYQAALAISGLYINVILQAMGKDFYPRLTAVANEPIEEIKIINEQTEIGMIMAAPGLLFTLALAPIAIDLLYTTEYAEAYPILQWMIVGVFLRTISWPMGFLFIARAKAKYFFWLQMLNNALHLFLVFWLISTFGLVGAGIGFFILYILHVLYMYVLIRRENGYEWEPVVIRNVLIFAAIFAASFLILNFTGPWVGTSIVVLFAILLSLFAIKKMMQIMEVSSIKALLNLIKNKFRKNKE